MFVQYIRLRRGEMFVSDTGLSRGTAVKHFCLFSRVFILLWFCSLYSEFCPVLLN